jgi:protein-S-isoprenylcysteine O-methyltransferase Ste14
MNAWRQARAVAALPGTVVVAVPGVILFVGGGPEIGWGLAGIAAAIPVVIASVLIGTGLAIWLWTVRIFAEIGQGTLAPWDPTRKLVVVGPYRYMRNPMIAAVVTILIGEAFLFGSPWLLGWALMFLGVNHLGFLIYEEPLLERRFGEEYRAYKFGVPRWIPRRTPWLPRVPQAQSNTGA